MTKPRDRRYSSARWQRLRAEVIRRDGGRCAVADCRADMSEPGMRHVDHIVEVKDGGSFWDPGNLRLVCRFHHFEKSVQTFAGRATGSGRTQHRAARADLTPGDPAYCWRKGEDGLWHHFHPMHNMEDCEWPGCPHNKEYEEWKGRQ